MSNGLGEVILYETDSGETRLEGRLDRDTVWLSQEQMAALFDVQKAAVSKHLKNIFSSGELAREASVSKMETVQHEGARRVSRQIEHFNLDAVISVGYRVNSSRATRFRQWATGVLREHLTKGYTLNRHRFEANARELEAALKLVRKAAHLLYFVIKDHPFSDGNKRSAAFLFVHFLNRNARLLDDFGNPIINDIGLAALALLVAESAPTQKETMIRLIMNMLAGATDDH